MVKIMNNWRSQLFTTANSWTLKPMNELYDTTHCLLKFCEVLHSENNILFRDSPKYEHAEIAQTFGYQIKSVSRMAQILCDPNLQNVGNVKKYIKTYIKTLECVLRCCPILLNVNRDSMVKESYRNIKIMAYVHLLIFSIQDYDGINQIHWQTKEYRLYELLEDLYNENYVGAKDRLWKMSILTEFDNVSIYIKD